MEVREKYKTDFGPVPEDFKARQMDPLAITDWQALLALADLYLLQKNIPAARDTIALGLLNTERKPVLPADTSKRDVAARRRDWMPREAELAELEGDPQKALSIYQSYLQPYAKFIAEGSTSRVVGLAARVEKVKRLYLANGGREDAWLEWVGAGKVPDSAAARPAGLQYSAPLANFESKDLSGKTWKLDDLKGKATFIDIWATWCGPCRAEHPELQRLYQAVRGRKDIQILTFSVDETAYLAEAYLKEKSYTFPAIVSKELVERLFPTAGLPQAWIIDAQGRRSSPYRLMTVETALAELEKAAAAGR
jgi:thiol-disulfide isomerase/thioredoxin